MPLHRLVIRGREFEFRITVFPDRNKAYDYIDANWGGRSGRGHPPICVSPELFRDESGSASRSITTDGVIVRVGTVEVWENEDLNGESVADLMLDGMARPKGEEEGDRPYDKERLKEVIVAFYARHNLRVFKIGYSSISMKSGRSGVSLDAATEAARLNRKMFVSPAGRRSVAAVAKDFHESGLIVLGYD